MRRHLSNFPMVADWAALPPELLRTIAEFLTLDAADYIRFRAVCSSWRSSSPETPPNLPQQLPWLMFHSSPVRHSRFFSLSADKIHSLDLPEIPSLCCLGSSHGWLAFLDAPTGSLSLLNPLTRSSLPLPPLSSFPDVISVDLNSIDCEYSIVSGIGEISHISLHDMRMYFIKKIIISSNPSVDQNYIVLALLNMTGKVAIYKNGDRSWRYIEDAQSYYRDAIYFNGLFYSVNEIGSIAVFDVHGPLPRVSIIMTMSLDPDDLHYLASSSDGDLLLIVRHLEFDDLIEEDYHIYRKITTKFEVFHLDLIGAKWDAVTDMGDKAVFLGENSTLVLSSRDFRSCRGNCIYYTDDRFMYFSMPQFGSPDSGIYNLGNGSIDPLPCYYHNTDCQGLWPQPVWVTPYPFL